MHVVTGEAAREDDRRRPRPRAGLPAGEGRWWSRSRAGRASPGSSTPDAALRGAQGRGRARRRDRLRARGGHQEQRCSYLDMFYKMGRAAGSSGGRRLRDDRRARPPRRAAHRQGLRGRRPTTVRTHGVRRRRGARRPSEPGASRASSTSTPRWPGWPARDRSGPRSVGPGSWGSNVPRTLVHVVTLEMPVQETADGIAEVLLRPACP